MADARGARGETGTRKPGLVYVPYVPPGLKPARMRALLSVHTGCVGRIYLVPEPDERRRARRRAGGDRGKRYTEGWVEFHDKKEAKRIAHLLNGQPLSGPRRSRLAEALWNLRYLPGFRWEHLAEELAARKRGRALRAQREERQAKLEKDAYQQAVASAKSSEHAQRRLLSKNKSPETQTPSSALQTRKAHQAAVDLEKAKRKVKQAKAQRSKASGVSASTLASLFPSSAEHGDE